MLGTQAAINSLKAITIVDKVDFANKKSSTTRIGAHEKGNRDKQKSTAKTSKTAVNYDYGTASNQIVMLKEFFTSTKFYWFWKNYCNSRWRFLALILLFLLLDWVREQPNFR
jgi:hypothetical protein